MSTITISLSGSTIVNGSKNYTLSDTTVTRLINGMKYYYGSSLTDAQVLSAWVDGLIDTTKKMVVDAEKNTAVVAAVDIS